MDQKTIEKNWEMLTRAALACDFSLGLEMDMHMNFLCNQGDFVDVYLELVGSIKAILELEVHSAMSDVNHSTLQVYLYMLSSLVKSSHQHVEIKSEALA